ncbi:MAG: ADP-forming succinate--CoA ligase subunit beta [Chitinophagales bacterium]|nr:ADP-forming succinate--CoA ligase subunit beta [Chitinophagales bacterium]MDW8428322.1 ADP-forming succinate--CoA ligase subunit beta [Chitinophagales bacterium]
MNIHEYQAKALLKRYGVTVQEGIAVESVDAAVEAAKQLKHERQTKFWVIKAQIHAGGRGKGGGVKVADSLEAVYQKASAILGMTLVTPQTGPTGKKVHKILVAEDVYHGDPAQRHEFYCSILVDREKKCNVIVYSAQGGMDIEEVAEHHPEAIYKEWVDPMMGLMPYQARRIAYRLSLNGEAHKNMVQTITALYRAFVDLDASLIEINPLLKTADNRIVAVDAKVKLDDNALFRHKEYADLRDITEEDPAEVEASRHNLNFIKLDGNVGCMVNGAGLAMATMDMIKLAGGSPANFLDVGGTANAQTVEAGFRIILADPNVKAILINIFGGIVRCDRVAQGIIDAYRNIGSIPVPLIVRLQGTNADVAKEMIDKSGLKVKAAVQLREAAELVNRALAE